MARLNRSEANLDLTPMIDVVFQLIIFFVVTIKMDRDLINEDIRLGKAPDAKAIEKKEPNTVVVEVDKDGRISIGRTRLAPRQLKAIMTQTRKTAGDRVPVLIRADQETKHHAVRLAMDAVTAAGLWRIKFAAVKQEAEGKR